MVRERQWKELERNQCERLRLSDIPFPEPFEMRDVLQHLGGGKKAFNKLALRFHPDKFRQRFGVRLDASEREGILCAADACWNALLEAGEGCGLV